MILLSAIHKNESVVEYKIYGTNTPQFLVNTSIHRDGVYKFKEPIKGSEKGKFMIEISGNREVLIEGVKLEIVHYILLKEKENSRYLIDKEFFDILFLKCN